MKQYKEGVMTTKNYSYRGTLEGNECAECGSHDVSGEAVFATGEPLEWGYEPFEGEILKFLWLECAKCGWNQSS